MSLGSSHERPVESLFSAGLSIPCGLVAQELRLL